MHITFDFSTIKKKTQICAQQGEYDSPIMCPIIFDAVPFLISPDRLYVAASLLFHTEISGELVVAGDYACSRHVAIQIQRFFDPVDVHVAGQSMTPVAIASGQYKAVMSVLLQGRTISPPLNRQKGDVTFSIVPESGGAIFSESTVWIGSNLTYRGSNMHHAFDDIIRMMGVAVVMAQDMHIDGFHIPSADYSFHETQRLRDVQALLSCVGLKFDWT